MFEEKYMSKRLDKIKYDLGIARIVGIVAGIYGYDWEWFLSEIKTQKTPIATNVDEKTLVAIATALKELKPLCEYLNDRGIEVQKQARSANLN